jgi:hypothetical protein
MKAFRSKYLIVSLAASLFLTPLQAKASAGVTSTFAYSLANFYGKVPYSDVRIRVDRPRDEVYVIDKGVVRVFNDTGMEVFWFGDDPELEGIYDLTLDEKGDIYLLSYDFSVPGNPIYHTIRCNFRGEARERFIISGVPKEFSGFFPNQILYQNGKFHFLSSSQMRVVVTDPKGVFLKGYDLADILEIPEKNRPDTEIFGFNLDSEGNMLITVPVMFRAFVVSPDGKLEGAFGKAGSAPGMFGVVSGIARDDQGNYLVVERLRSVVMVYDKGYQFLHEFGHRGDKPYNLIRPNEVEVGNSGKIYVTQVMKRGVSVFHVTTD